MAQNPFSFDFMLGLPTAGGRSMGQSGFAEALRGSTAPTPSGGSSAPFTSALASGGASTAAGGAFGGGSDYNSLFDPSQRGVFGFLGRLMGAPTRDEAIRSRAGAAQNEAYQGLSKRVAQGMSPQKALADFIGSPEGAQLFANDPNAQETISNALTMLTPSADEIKRQGRAEVFGAEDAAPAGVTLPQNPASRLLSPGSIADGTAQPQGRAQTPTLGPTASQRNAYIQKAQQLAARGDAEGARLAISIADSLDPTADDPVVKVYDPNSPTGETYVRKGEAAGQAAPPRFSTKESESAFADAFGKEIGKSQAERIGKIIEKGHSAATVLTQLRTMDELIGSQQFTTGFAGNVRLSLSQMLSFFGLDTQAGALGNMGLGDPAIAETLTTYSNNLAMQMANDFEGLRSTNLSLQLLQDAVPNLTKTPGGNKLIIDLARTQYERAQQAARFADSYLIENDMNPAPTGKPSLTVELANLQKTWAEDDKALSERIRQTAAEGRGIGWDSLVDEARKLNEGDTSDFTGGNALPSFATSADLEAAAARGEIKPGTKVIVGGKQGTWYGK